MIPDKPIEVTINHSDFGMVCFSFILALFLFVGKPSIYDSLRVYLAHLAGLTP